INIVILFTLFTDSRSNIPLHPSKFPCLAFYVLLYLYSQLKKTSRNINEKYIRDESIKIISGGVNKSE
ncbi:hypothetical protein HHI36_013215, partial [Cryptolaemus montrouzieri]